MVCPTRASATGQARRQPPERHREGAVQRAQHRAAHGRRGGAGLRREAAHERADAAQAARRLRQGAARSARARARDRPARPARVLVLRRGPQHLGHAGRAGARSTSAAPRATSASPAASPSRRARRTPRCRAARSPASAASASTSTAAAPPTAPNPALGLPRRRAQRWSVTYRRHARGARQVPRRRGGETANGSPTQLYECNNTAPSSGWRGRTAPAQRALGALPSTPRAELGQRHAADHLGLPRRREPALGAPLTHGHRARPLASRQRPGGSP